MVARRGTAGSNVSLPYPCDQPLMCSNGLDGTFRGRLPAQHGPEWHCIIGVHIVVDVRYWRAKCFVFEGNGMKIMVFKSAPAAPGTGAPRDDPARRQVLDERSRTESEADSKTRANRTRIEVLSSDMDGAYREWVLGMVVAAAKDIGKADGVASVVSALKALLTESVGPVWHAAGAKAGSEWGCSLAHEAGQMMEFRLKGHRFVVWKHAQVPRLADALTMGRLASLLFVATFLLLFLYVKFQNSCRVCCSTNAAARSRANCDMAEIATEDGGSGVSCSQSEIEDADRCVKIASVLLMLSGGVLAAATALKWAYRNPGAK